MPRILPNVCLDRYRKDGAELHGRCQHAIVEGDGGFAGAKGVPQFKDDVVNLTFDIRRQIMLASPDAQSVAVAVQDAAKSSGSARSTQRPLCRPWLEHQFIDVSGSIQFS